MINPASSKFYLSPLKPENTSELVAAVLESTATVGQWMAWANSSYSLKQAEAWIAHCDKERVNESSFEFGIFETETDRLVGCCGLNQFNLVNNFCNLGYWIRESYQRHGAGLTAVQALAEFGFKELNLGRIEIVVASTNTPSIALAEKASALCECLARNRLKIHGSLVVDAYVFSIVPNTGTSNHKNPHLASVSIA